MRLRHLLQAVMLAGAVFLIVHSSAAADDPPAPPVVEIDRTVDGLNVDEWKKESDRWHRVAARYRRQMLVRWHPTVDYALRLASAIYGVSYWQMRTVSFCESRWYVFARNGPHLGIFQMHWRPFGFSQFDPVASALSAAQTVVHDGGWRQWECKP